MKDTYIFKQLLQQYGTIENKGLSGRHIQQRDIQPFLDELGEMFKLTQIGESVLGDPIHSIGFGYGKIKVLAWSQMHGNEATTTKAVFDLLNFIRSNRNEEPMRSILSQCCLCIIPMLNPDGAKLYTRVNANKVDLNRDAQDQSQPETRILCKIFRNFSPDFCLNLHDQRSIFSVGNSPKSAVLSFLTPAMDKERQIFPSRITSMQLIAKMAKDLSDFLPGNIGRYDDAFNINCTGDFFQSSATPTILFEAGHFPEDYNREETRKYVFLAILAGLKSISEQSFQDMDYHQYLEIPENQKLFNDIILREVHSEMGIVDMAIQYREVLRDGKFLFLPVIEEIGTRINKYAHREIFCKNKKTEILSDRELSENVVVNKVILNDVEIAL